VKKLKPLKRRGYANDPQVLAVYRFEGRWLHWNEQNTTLTLCRQLVKKACQLYGVKPAVVTWGPDTEPYKPRSRPCTYFDPNTNRILLRKRHWNYAVALHEAAHCIAWHRFGHRAADHGPAWLGIYLWLLAANLTAPIVALEAAAALDGLEWVPIERSSPAAIKRLRVTP
jgi:hypothetical protein